MSLLETYKRAASRLKGRQSFPTLFAKLPMSVLMDRELSPADKCVFAGLAWIAKRSNNPQESHGQLSAILGLSERQVRRSLQALATLGHLKPAEANRRGRLGAYTLASQVFEPNGIGDPCLKCGTPTRKLGPAGWCVKCVRLVNAARKPAIKAVA